MVVGVVSTEARKASCSYRTILEVPRGGAVLLMESLALGPPTLLHNGHHLGFQEGCILGVFSR